MLDLPPVVEQARKLTQRQRALVEELSFQDFQYRVGQALAVLLSDLLQLLLGKLQVFN